MFFSFPFLWAWGRKFETVADWVIRVGSARGDRRSKRRKDQRQATDPSDWRRPLKANSKRKCPKKTQIGNENKKSEKNNCKPSVLISSLGPPLPFWLFGFLFRVWIPSLRIASGLELWKWILRPLWSPHFVTLSLFFLWNHFVAQICFVNLFTPWSL